MITVPRLSIGLPVYNDESLPPEAIEAIGAGALILDRIMSAFGFAEVLVSEHDILDSIAWSVLP
jgi:hypothetical protein